MKKLNNNLKNIFMEWNSNERKKPLILRGKDTDIKLSILKDMSKEYYENIIELNFKQNKDSIYEFDFTKTLSENLSIVFKKEIDFHQTLIILDEIQEFQNPLELLRYLSKETYEYPLVIRDVQLGSKVWGNSYLAIGKFTVLNL